MLLNYQLWKPNSISSPSMLHLHLPVQWFQFSFLKEEKKQQFMVVILYSCIHFRMNLHTNYKILIYIYSLHFKLLYYNRINLSTGFRSGQVWLFIIDWWAVTETVWIVFLRVKFCLVKTMWKKLRAVKCSVWFILFVFFCMVLLLLDSNFCFYQRKAERF